MLQTPTQMQPGAPGESHRTRKNRNQRAYAARRRQAELEADPERKQALEQAQRLIWEAEQAPDEETRREIYRIVRNLQLRNTTDEEQQRSKVLTELERLSLSASAVGMQSTVGMSVRELANETKLTLEQVKAALEYLTRADVDLVEMFERGGRLNAGRCGTVIYYRLTHKRPAVSPPR